MCELVPIHYTGRAITDLKIVIYLSALCPHGFKANEARVYRCTPYITLISPTLLGPLKS